MPKALWYPWNCLPKNNVLLSNFIKPTNTFRMCLCVDNCWCGEKCMLIFCNCTGNGYVNKFEEKELVGYCLFYGSK